ncbi:RHS repeat-associated core domain-containing protein [Pedobacter sp. G11]|nr:RHS repeat-associated core domain-containing protein [Pedobacter sp. G11]
MKKLITGALVAAAAFAQSNICFAQDNHKRLLAYDGAQNISAPLSVTLEAPFHIPPPAPGTSVRIFTTGRSYADCRPFVSSASSNQNFISTRIFRAPGIDPNNLSGRGICEVNETVQYLDGFGRPLQTVIVNGGLPGHDVVQPVGYDAFGREDKKYLPYSVWNNNGAYRSDAISGGGQAAYYNNPPSASIPQTGAAFGKVVFEASPLNRVLEQGSAGTDWQPVAGSDAGHTLKQRYGTNASGEVRRWVVSGNGASIAQDNSGYYLAGRLYLSTSNDENWQPGDEMKGATQEFKDLEGRVVLKRTWETVSKSLNTYYVYDDLGNLRYVLPPAVNLHTDRPDAGEISSFIESDPVFDRFIYGYHYDGRNRVIRKKVPGKGWEELIYNPLDQVVFSQDAVQAQRAERAFTKYDALGRVTMTGVEIGHTGTRIDVQATVNSYGAFWDKRSTAGNNLHGYDNASAPGNYPNMQIDVVNYYDDYDIPGLPHNESASFSNMTKGLLTASKVKVLGTTDQFLWTVNYYDREGRVVKSYSQHYLTGAVSASNYDIVENVWKFDGNLMNSVRMHYANGQSTKIATRYEYDHMGRKAATFENINDAGEVNLSYLAYNELGQLQEKKLHNETQGTKLTYNERGWLRSSKSNEFSMELKYNDAVDGAEAQYNGNIANQRWGAGEALPYTFVYTYDRLNRLKRGAASGLSYPMSEQVEYDVMGNLKYLSRDGGNANSYDYQHGNRLWYVAYVTNGYAYDVNGNATTDGRSGYTVQYNHFNLPFHIPNINLTYTYDGTGRKIRKNSNGSVRNYIDGIEYKPDGTIDFIQTEEGLALNNGSGGYSYQYNLTDHLGNVRYSFDIYNGAVRRLQQDDYYPFGLRKSISPVATTNKYLYNGKEVQDELGGQYDYGARFYDPVIGRFSTVDPLADEFDHMSPYNYAMNNPILMIDPDGMAADTSKKVTPPPKPKPIELKEVIIKSGKWKGWVANGTTIFGTAQYRLPQAVLEANRAEAAAFLGRWTPLGRAITLVSNLLDIANSVSYTPAPKELKGFPTAKRAPNKGRARWKTSDGKILEWDSQHGDVEVYDKQGKHLGSASPETGQMTKDAVPGRTTRK